MLSDIEISNQTKPFKINEIAKHLNLTDEDIEPYGKYKAKLSRETTHTLTTSDRKGKLVLVTALTPTPAGEGKSTVSIGLADAFHKLNYKSCLSLREPSLGPCFGIKGGATGGGYSQVVPMEDINLNFTGDIHAITSANNLLCALIDNHIKHGNALDIQKVYFKRCVDLNDRALREITIAQGSPINGTPRQDGFNISVASEVMAILCLSENITDLKQRIDNIVIAENSKQEPIYAKDIKASGAMTAILKDAILPNLVQTLEQTPAIIHGGPFANIAHGTSSIIAARSALALADYVVTEAGFGADLGAEKFFDIFARQSNLYPDAVIIVSTIRALKMHGGVKKEDLNQENLIALKDGFANLKAHITNIRKFGYNPIIAINKFIKDTDKEIQLLKDLCEESNVTSVLSEGWEKGGNGCIDLANAVINQIENKTNIYSPLHLLYPSVASLKEKIEIIAKEIYNAKDVSFTDQALKDLEKFSQWGYKRLPICIAKTQNSISHDKKLLGAPSGFTFPITEVRLSAGAGFVVALSGEITTMPGLPKVPAAENIDVDENGIISGLF